MGAKLKPYMQNSGLKQRLHVISNPDDQLEWAAGPINVDGEGDDRKRVIFRPHASLEGKPVGGAPARSYDRMLWAAFSVPIPAGQRRIVRLGNPIEFRSQPDSDSVPEGWHEVPGSLVIPVGPEQPVNRSEKLAQNIESWAQAQQIALPDSKSEPRQVHTSLLHHVLEALDERGLADTQMTLRSVKILLGRHV